MDRFATELTEKSFSSTKRDRLAKKGQAMPGGGFPIESEQDLKNAIQAFGRAKDKAAAKRHIKKRARALGLTKLLPEGWSMNESASAALLESLRLLEEGTDDGHLSDDLLDTFAEQEGDIADPFDDEDEEIEEAGGRQPKFVFGRLNKAYSAGAGKADINAELAQIEKRARSKGLKPSRSAILATFRRNFSRRAKKGQKVGSSASALKTATGKRKEAATLLQDGESMISRLQEVGKVFSSANAAKLKMVLDSVKSMLMLVKEVSDDEEPSLEDLEGRQKEEKRQELLTVAKKKLGVAATEAARLVEAEFSFDQRRTQVADALSGAAPAGQRCWIVDLYNDYAIYREEVIDTYESLGTFKRGYTFDEQTGEAVLKDDRVEVVEQRSWLPVASSDKYTEAADYAITGELIPLLEKAVRKDGTAPIKVISPGWGTTGYYSADVLKRDGPGVFKKGTHMHWDHPTQTEEAERPERSLDTLAGALESDAYWNENGPKGPGLYADAKIMTPYREAVDELAPHIGTSIRAWGSAVYGQAEGRKGPIVESLKSADSVDFVTTPGRGGEVLQLFEAARGGRWASVHKPTTTPLTSRKQESSEDSNVGDEDKKVTQLEEANRQLAEQDTTIRRLQAKDLLRDARDMVTATLREADLPDFAKVRLVESLSKNPPSTDTGELDREKFKEAVDKAIKAEADYLQEAMGPGYNGRVRGVGPLTEAGLADFTDPVKADAALEDAFKAGGFALSESGIKSAAAGRRI